MKMQELRQHQHEWFMKPELCGMESLRLRSIDLDPRSYGCAQPFVGEFSG